MGKRPYRQCAMLSVSLRCSFWHFMKFMTLLASFLSAFPRKWTQLTVNNLRQGHAALAGHTKRRATCCPGLCPAIRTAALSKYFSHYAEWYISLLHAESDRNRGAAAGDRREIPETLGLCQKLKVAACCQIAYLQKRAPALRAYDNPKSKAPSAHFMQRPPTLSPPPPPPRPVWLLGRKLATQRERERSRINYQAAGI